MKSLARWYAAIAVALLVLATVLAVKAYGGYRRRQFEGLQPGMSKEQVLRAVGRPDSFDQQADGLFFNCELEKITECWAYDSRIAPEYSVCFTKGGLYLCAAERIVWH